MILPDKNIDLRHSLLGFGSLILPELKNMQTVSSLWEKMREDGKIRSYEKYVLTLDFLFAIKLIKYESGLIKLKPND